ncbi:MAG: hypothetical protein L3J28_07040 [Candidatus Polarisedimenticolaceae bacterium]|nr:hypothetical protein [Candidatus Polarisedimenticolaceae bacterium]
MSRSRKFSGAHLLLALSGLGLASYLVLTLLEHGITEATDSSTKTASADDWSYANFSTLPLKDYAETIERPLFSRSRRPAVAIQAIKKAQPINAPAVSKLPTPLLIGIIISGGVKTALIRTHPTSELQRVKEQEYIDGWLAAEITKQSVVLISQSGINQLLELKNNKPRPTTKRRANRRTSQVQSKIEQQRKRLESMKRNIQNKATPKAPIKAQIVNPLKKGAQ